MPVLAGVDAAFADCYLMADVLHPDAETWAIDLFDPCAKAVNPELL